MPLIEPPTGYLRGDDPSDFQLTVGGHLCDFGDPGEYNTDPVMANIWSYGEREGYEALDELT